MTRAEPGRDIEAPSSDSRRWSLAVFSHRESASALSDNLAAAASGELAGARLTIDLLVNGNDRLAAAMRDRLADALWRTSATTVRLWRAPRADKAQAWNDYLHGPIPPESLVFFMDGYVTVERDTLARVADALARRPTALAATCVPSVGPSAQRVRRQVLTEGGLHGNLYALTAATVRRLRACGFRLPLGIYRNDSALGAALAFDLDPAANEWSHDRIVAVPEARYRTPQAGPASAAALAALLRRRLRQARGHVETLALQAHLAEMRRPPSAWPETARGLVLQWADEHPAAARALLWTKPMAWNALRRLQAVDDARPSGRFECLGEFAPDPMRRNSAAATVR